MKSIIIIIVIKSDVDQLFSARLHIIQSTLYAVACPSVYLSQAWISQKRLKLGLDYAIFTVLHTVAVSG